MCCDNVLLRRSICSCSFASTISGSRSGSGSLFNDDHEFDDEAAVLLAAISVEAVEFGSSEGETNIDMLIRCVVWFVVGWWLQISNDVIL